MQDPDKKQNELNSRLERQNKALQDIMAQKINVRNTDLSLAIKDILEIASETMKTERVSVWLYDELKTNIKCIDLFEKSKRTHTDGVVLYSKNYPSYFKALESNRVINADDANKDLRTFEFSKDYLVPLGITSMLDAPVRRAGNPVGVVCFEHVAPMRSWTIDEQLFAGAIADSVSILLESAERIAAEEALRQKEEQLATIYDTVGDMLFCLSVEKDGRYKFTSINRAFESTTGLAYRQVVGKYVEDIIPQPLLNLVLQKYQQAIRMKSTVHWEEVSKYPSGERIGEVSLSPIFDQAGNCTFLIGSVHDITDRKSAENEIRKLNNELEEKVKERTSKLESTRESLELSEKKYRKILEEAGDVVYSIDRTGHFTYINPMVKKLTGFSEEELLGKRFSDIIEPEWRDKVADFYRLQLENKAAESIYAFPIITRSGQKKWVEQIVTPQQEGKRTSGFHAIVRDITEKQRAEEILKEYEYLFKSSHDLLTVANMEGYFEIINPNFQKVLGYSEKELTETPYVNFIHPGDVDATLKEIEKLKAGTETVNFINRYRKKDGSYVLFDWNATPDLVRGKLYAAARDITEKKKIEDKLVESEEHFRTLAENAPVLIMRVSKDARIQYINWTVPPFTPKEVVGHSVYEFIDPGTKDEYTKNLETVFKTGEVARFEVRGMRANKEMGWYFSTVAPIRGRSGIDSVIILTSDITDQKKIQEELSEKASLLQATFDSSFGGILVVDKSGKIVVQNKRFQTLWKIPDKILETRDDTKILNFIMDQLKDPTRFLNKVKELYGHPEKESFDVLEFKDGRVFERYSMPQRLNGEVVGRVWSFIDVTEKKKAEERLVSSEHFLDSVVNNIPNMIFVKDAKDLRFVRFNKAGEDLLGYKQNELVGKNDYDFFPKEEADFFTAKDKKVLESGKLIEIEEEPVHTKHRGERILETKKIPILDSNGRPLYLLGISNDITSHKMMLDELEKKTNELKRSNTELEQFAYVASHDLQEPLRTIANYVGLLEESYAASHNEDVKEYLTFITTASSRMQNLIKDLLEFSRVGRNPLFVRVDCNKIVKEVVREMDAAIGESGAKIRFSKLPVVNGIEVELKRLFQNLLSNAIKFRKKDSVPEIEIHAVKKEREYLFSIRDNGVGMEEKFLPKLFIIFQRLPNASEYAGTGIGLATAKKIVNLHGGKIWAESKLNEGSVFYFTINRPNSGSNGS